VSPERRSDERDLARALLAQRQSRRLGRLVDELLDVSRLQLGRVELHNTDIDVIAAMRETLERTRLQDPTRVFDLKEDAGTATVLGDRDRIDQVFENLISNAMKYSPADSPVTVTVSIEDDEAHIAVTDRGIGIAPDELERIFNLFYRSPDPRAGHVSGLGLGLFISREIVKRHGGSLSAESGKDGSTFHVRLPVVAAVTGDAVTSRGGATRD